MRAGWEQHNRAYLAELNGYRVACDDIFEQIDQCLRDVGTAEESYRSVADRSRSLQEACEKLLEQQTHMASLAESLADRLSYFNELEAIAKLFNTPGEAIVLHERFLPSLSRLDQCLAYVDANVRVACVRRDARVVLMDAVFDHLTPCSSLPSPQPALAPAGPAPSAPAPALPRPHAQASFRDAELYRMKFRQCLTRGLTLIKLYFADVLKGLLTELLQRLAKDKVRARAGASASEHAARGTRHP